MQFLLVLVLLLIFIGAICAIDPINPPPPDLEGYVAAVRVDSGEVDVRPVGGLTVTVVVDSSTTIGYRMGFINLSQMAAACQGNPNAWVRVWYVQGGAPTADLINLFDAPPG